MDKGRNLLKYSALVLFVFSIIQLALALGALMVSDFVSFATQSGIIQELFVTSSQNMGMVVVEGALGAAVGFLGLYMSRNGAAFYTYQRFGILSLVIYLVVDVIVFSMSPAIPWINAVFVVIVAIGFALGWYQYKDSLDRETQK